MSSERYSFSLTTFSPSGKLVQIEYALAAVSAGAPSVSIKATNGSVVVTENKFKSSLSDPSSINKVEKIDDHIGMVYSGLGPDFRVLVSHARKTAQTYKLRYGSRIPLSQLVQRVAAVMQEYTQSGGVRPFGVSLLVIGWDGDRPGLYQCDPSGAFFPWRATAIGKNFTTGRTFLEKRYNDTMELEDAVYTALLTLKETFDGQMTQKNVQVGISDAKGFRRLSEAEVRDYMANLV